MIKFLDDFLNQITQYRLMLYVLFALLLIAFILSFFGLMPFKPLSLALSASLLTAVCWITNKILAKFFNAPANAESFFITAWILSLIITPAGNFNDFIFLGVAGILAMASKYILAIHKKHIFNPAALAVFVTGITLNRYASWWVGNSWMIIPVLIGGFLIIKKVQRFSMVFSFLFISLIFQRLTLDGPLFFFAFIMLTEPQTTPPTKRLQILYGGLIGLISQTPEIGLLIGNIFSYIVSPKYKLLLSLKQKLKIAPDIYEFVFSLDKKISYSPGQYMEWTLSHKSPDLRGNRRYFTVASSPTEDSLRIGVKFYPSGSSFKKTLSSMETGDKIVASQLSGEFTLPKEQNKKLMFLAGGIGITPFRSIIKYLLDKNEKRDIVLFYANQKPEDVVYKDIFTSAQKRLGIKVVYVVGFITEEMIKKQAPDYKNRIFYISGPHSMVDAFEKTLKEMGVGRSQIKTDFFPGYV